MSKITRYFHLRKGTKGGATVVVTGDADALGQVDVQFALCSKRDSYVKATGRSEAHKAPVKIVPLRYLPQELGRIAEKARIRNQVDYTFAIKYFLPKE